MPSIRNVLINAALVAASMCAGLAIIEAALTVSNPFDSRVSGSRIVLPSNRQYAIQKNDGKGVPLLHTKNVLGFRGPPPPIGDSSGPRWIFVGGSTTEEFFKEDGRSWPELLAADLAPSMPNLWVNNAGLDGHSTFGHIVLLREFLLGLKPDAVFFLLGINDVGYDAPKHFDTRLQPPWLERPGIETVSHFLRERTEVGRLVSLIKRRLMVKAAGTGYAKIDIARETSHPSEGDRESLSDEVVGAHAAAIAGFARRVNLIVDLCISSGIVPVLITQPLLPGPAIDPTTNADLGRIRVRGMGGAAFWALLEIYNGVTRRAAAEFGTPLIDLALLLEKDSAYFDDVMHFSAAGSERVAAIVAGQVREVLPALLAWRSGG